MRSTVGGRQEEAGGATDAAIKAELATYDQWDRNDFDNDGNFNEPDGYLDHFQIVHAGGDQADVDPIFGEDAIWSHRWKAFQGTGQGPTGNKDGGVQIGSTGLWVADYTIQPENGGLSVFAHEYGHDLGLPDDYDTATGGYSPNEWWTLMAQSRLSAPVRRSAPRLGTSAPGRSSSSAGSTTRSPSRAPTRWSTSARRSTTPKGPGDRRPAAPEGRDDPEPDAAGGQQGVVERQR